MYQINKDFLIFRIKNKKKIEQKKNYWEMLVGHWKIPNSFYGRLQLSKYL